MFEEPIRFFEDVIKNNRSVLDMLYGELHLRESGAREALRDDDIPEFKPAEAKPACAVACRTGPPGARVCGPLRKCRYLGSGRRRGQVRPRRFAADGRVPDAEFSRSENQPGEARILGGAAASGRGDSSAAPRCSGAAAGRSQDRMRRCATCWRSIASNPVCAGCHARFDMFGLAMEGYGPVGEKREQRPRRPVIDASATFPGGYRGLGIPRRAGVHQREAAERLPRQPQPQAAVLFSRQNAACSPTIRSLRR